MDLQGLRIYKTMLKTKNKAGLVLSVFETYYHTMVITLAGIDIRIYGSMK